MIALSCSLRRRAAGTRKHHQGIRTTIKDNVNLRHGRRTNIYKDYKDYKHTVPFSIGRCRRSRHRSIRLVEFVPFSIEIGGVWGPAARKFLRESIAMAHSDRDIDLYHFTGPTFA